MQEPKYKIGIDTMEQLAAKTLALNEIGVAVVHTARPIVFEPYEQSRALGGFILIDRLSAATVAAGLIRFALRRSENVHEQALDVTPERRAALKQQQPKLLWFTGLCGAGKSTIANLVEAQAARARAPHLPARRRQCPARPQQGSRLHRRRPGREYPPRRRGGEADDGRRA